MTPEAEGSSMSSISTTSLATSIAALALLCLPTSALAFGDIDLLGPGEISPNVLIGFDTSGSMREIMYPPTMDTSQSTCSLFTYFAPSGSPWMSAGSGSGTKNDQNGDPIDYQCDSNTRHCRVYVKETQPGFVQTGTYSCPGGGTVKEGYIQRKLCGNTRRLYADPHIWCDGYRTWHSGVPPLS
jgi:hypothetical protein